MSSVQQGSRSFSTVLGRPIGMARRYRDPALGRAWRPSRAGHHATALVPGRSRWVDALARATRTTSAVISGMEMGRAIARLLQGQPRRRPINFQLICWTLHKVRKSTTRRDTAVVARYHALAAVALADGPRVAELADRSDGEPTDGSIESGYARRRTDSASRASPTERASIKYAWMSVGTTGGREALD